MQGVIIKYKEEEGYGFILDENYNERFFHISEISDKNHFLENIHSYLYSDEYNNNCYMLEFIPGKNEKGTTAKEIFRTDQILNNRAISQPFEAEVIDISYEVETFIRIVQGIKKNHSAPPGTTKGSDGTFRIGYPEVFRELHLKFKKTEGMGWGEIRIRELVLRQNNRKKITSGLVEKLKNKLTGTTIVIRARNNQWELVNNSDLIL